MGCGIAERNCHPAALTRPLQHTDHTTCSRISPSLEEKTKSTLANVEGCRHVTVAPFLHTGLLRNAVFALMTLPGPILISCGPLRISRAPLPLRLSHLFWWLSFGGTRSTCLAVPCVVHETERGASSKWCSSNRYGDPSVRVRVDCRRVLQVSVSELAHWHEGRQL